MKVLLLEDEYLLNHNIKEYLELKDCLVMSYLDGDELLENSSLQADIAIPGATGYEVIEWVKRVQENTPVIFMTAYIDIESIKKGYSLGCSDYLKKPFELEELWLRITRLLDSSCYTKIALSSHVIFDLANEQLYYGTDLVKLTKIQRSILKLLIENKNSIVTYEMLINEIWNDFFIKTNTIASHIKKIRRFIPDNMIESIRAEGYRLHLRNK